MQYRTLSDYFQSLFHCRVQKIPVNAGLSCPNRDGTLGRGGCIFCNNDAFVPRYAEASAVSITEQVAKGIEFFSKKVRSDGYLVYFQSYSNTYGKASELIEKYEEALSCPGVLGLVIATRPDCLADELLDWMEMRFGTRAGEGRPYLLVEIGVESTNDATLERINRGHDFKCAKDAIESLAKRGIPVGVHLILGLPGETMEDFIQHARRISELPVTTLKLHQLQIIKGTALAREYAANPDCVHLLTPQEYLDAARAFVANLREDIVLDRIVSESPKDMVIAPAWGLKPSEMVL